MNTKATNTHTLIERGRKRKFSYSSWLEASHRCMAMKRVNTPTSTWVLRFRIAQSENMKSRGSEEILHKLLEHTKNSPWKSAKQRDFIPEKIRSIYSVLHRHNLFWDGIGWFFFAFSASCKHELSIFVPVLIGLIYSKIFRTKRIDPFYFSSQFKLDCLAKTAKSDKWLRDAP